MGSSEQILCFDLLTCVALLHLNFILNPQVLLAFAVLILFPILLWGMSEPLGGGLAASWGQATTLI